MNQTDNLLALPAAAARLGVSIWTLRWWIQEGKVESNKLFGRRMVLESEIERLIAASKSPRRAGAARESENKEAQNQVDTLEVAA